MNKFKYLTYIVVVCLLISGSTIYAATINDNITSPFNSKHIIFEESGIINNQPATSQYGIWLDEQGRYKFVTISGLNSGDYEIWDGNKLYQYTELTKEIVVRDVTKNENPIPHKFLSRSTYERVQSDIKKGSINRVIATKTEKEYEKSVVDDINKNVNIKISINNDGYVSESTYSINGEIKHKLKMNMIEEFTEVPINFFELPNSEATVTEIK